MNAARASRPRCCACCTWRTPKLDHQLALAHLQRGRLRRAGVAHRIRAEFRAALADRTWDVVLSDYNLPGFSGLEALEMLQARAARLLPFILVSGEIGEDTAVEAMRNGASDYLLKNNLARLAPAVRARDRGRRATHLRARCRPTASWPPRASACPSWRSTCRPASRWSAPRSRARSTTTSAAR